MVDFRSGPIKEGIDNSVFILPAIIVGSLVIFFMYKLTSSLRQKERLKEEKRRLKQQRKEKEQKGGKPKKK